VIEELGRVGYGALRIEDVAAASGVNKTTIYRRWANKNELVDAALRRIVDPPPLPDTGSLRTDLLEMFHQGISQYSSPAGRGVIRVLQSESAHPEIESMSRKMRADHRGQRERLVERGIARGELPAATNASLLVEVLTVTIYTRLTYNESVDLTYIENVIDLILAGANSMWASAQAE
jgi:AcrR family transcriptional regulator